MIFISRSQVVSWNVVTGPYRMPFLADFHENQLPRTKPKSLDAPTQGRMEEQTNEILAKVLASIELDYAFFVTQPSNPRMFTQIFKVPRPKSKCPEQIDS
jgi:hypothetical protein